MQQSQLLALARCLDKQEWRDLQLFAASPLHNNREDVQALLRYLEHYLPKVKDTHLAKEMAWKKLFGQKPFDDAAMRYLMYLTQQVMQQFIAYQTAKNDEIATQIQLIQYLRQRNAATKIIETELKKTTQLLEKQAYRNSDYYHNKYGFEIEQYEFAISQQRSATSGFQELSDALNVYFIAQKLRQGCAALLQRSLNNKEIRIDFLAEVLHYVAQKKEMEDVPLVALFYHSYCALADNEDTIHFEKMKSLLFDSEAQFSRSELREFYLYAINCCIRRLNAAKVNYISEVFDIYRKGLKINILLEGNVLSRFTYNNIVMAGVRMKAFEWTEKFIHEYKPFLEEKFRESTFNHVLATFYFKKKDYTLAMNFLQNVEFDDVLHNLDARRMLLCIYYDLAEFEALEAHLEAFKIYLYRQKDLGYHRENCLNLIRYTRRLLQLDFSNELEINKLATEIKETTRLVETWWLLEKLA
jgi:hypothetical protein